MKIGNVSVFFTKGGENRHGIIWDVKVNGEVIGQVEKWHSLFVTNGHSFDTRNDAAAYLLDRHNEECDHNWQHMYGGAQCSNCREII